MVKKHRPTPTKHPSKHPSKPPCKKEPYTAEEVLAKLEREYGPFQWEPRSDPVTELVFTILSQHTSDINAERATKLLKSHFESWDQVAATSVQEIEMVIRPAGLASQKAPRIQGALQQIQELRGSLDLEFIRGLPLNQAKEWLQRLPGVGPKTAAVVLCFSLGMPAMAVDTHVHRVTRRLGLIAPKVTADKAHNLLEPMVPPDNVYGFHVALITHGRQVCKARKPLCQLCVLNLRCPSERLLPWNQGGS